MTDRWYEEAECRPGPSVDPDWFDLHLDSFDAREPPSETTRRHALALVVCADCPVAVECLDDARVRDDVGVRGGQVLNGMFGQSKATRAQRSRAATNRALKVLESLTAAGVSSRPLSPSAGSLSGPRSEAAERVLSTPARPTPCQPLSHNKEQ